ncbi:hypothetical protein Jiend_24150 [Micromonospora endophytica]|nr:hypothetical protein Jiend_24150 [Micromonospora endophytica]
MGDPARRGTGGRRLPPAPGGREVPAGPASIADLPGSNRRWTTQNGPRGPGASGVASKATSGVASGVTSASRNATTQSTRGSSPSRRLDLARHLWTIHAATTASPSSAGSHQ